VFAEVKIDEKSSQLWNPLRIVLDSRGALPQCGGERSNSHPKRGKSANPCNLCRPMTHHNSRFGLSSTGRHFSREQIDQPLDVSRGTHFMKRELQLQSFLRLYQNVGAINRIGPEVAQAGFRNNSSGVNIGKNLKDIVFDYLEDVLLVHLFASPLPYYPERLRML
jgi:hypothetical protein